MFTICVSCSRYSLMYASARLKMSCIFASAFFLEMAALSARSFSQAAWRLRFFRIDSGTATCARRIASAGAGGLGYGAGAGSHHAVCRRSTSSPRRLATWRHRARWGATCHAAPAALGTHRRTIGTRTCTLTPRQRDDGHGERDGAVAQAAVAVVRGQLHRAARRRALAGHRGRDLAARGAGAPRGAHLLPPR